MNNVIGNCQFSLTLTFRQGRSISSEISHIFTIAWWQSKHDTHRSCFHSPWVHCQRIASISRLSDIQTSGMFHSQTRYSNAVWSHVLCCLSFWSFGIGVALPHRHLACLNLYLNDVIHILAGYRCALYQVKVIFTLITISDASTLNNFIQFSSQKKGRGGEMWGVDLQRLAYVFHGSVIHSSDI